MSQALVQGLLDSSCTGLLVLARSACDPDVAPFVGEAHLGESFLLGRLDDGGALTLWLSYLTAMERQEAEATGLDLIAPDRLRVDEVRRRYGDSVDFWRVVLGRAFEFVGLEPGRLALGGRPALGPVFPALSSLAASGWIFEDGRPLLLQHRKRKSAGQIAAARRAADGVCAAQRRVASILAASDERPEGLGWRDRPLTVGTVRAEIASVLAAHGLSEPLGNIVAAGADGAVPHTAGDDGRILRGGESIVVDLFPKGQLFADCTRTFCVGEVPEQLAMAHRSVSSALEQAYASVSSGKRLWLLQESICGLFSEQGYATPITDPGTSRGYVHGLGHGVGYEIHEYPSFAKASGAEGILEVGDLFTLEPGLYDEGGGYGVRLEDLCLMTGQGPENLTPLPYDLDPGMWS